MSYRRHRIPAAPRPWAVCLLAAAALCWARPAHAYIDAGTGGLLIQLLLAGIAGAVVVLRMYWQKVKTFFSRGEK